MLRITQEEWSLAQNLPPEGITSGAVHIGLQTWMRAQAGVVVEFSVADGGPASAVWLAEAGWHAWCDQMLGTADTAMIDTVLLEDMAEWALSPLLAEINAGITQQIAPPRPCIYLSEQSGIAFMWQVEQVVFQAVLLGNTEPWFRHLHALIPTDSEPTGVLPSLQCALYAGECEFSLSALRRLMPGDGIVMRAYGDPRTGHFVLSPLQEKAAHVQINGDNTMHFTAFETDLENDCIETTGEHVGAESMSIDLEALPQKLLVEVGQVTMTLGGLRALQVGDTVEVNAEFSPEVALKLNGRVIGKGVLIGCRDRFLVQIRHWYLAGQDKRLMSEDGVNAR